MVNHHKWILISISVSIILHRSGSDVNVLPFDHMTLFLSVVSPLDRCPSRGVSGRAAAALSSTPPAPPAAPSVKLLGRDPMPGGCGPEQAERTTVGRAHAAHWRTPLTAWPATSAAMPGRPRKPSPGLSAPAAAPAPSGCPGRRRADPRAGSSPETPTKAAWHGSARGARCRTRPPLCPVRPAVDPANCPSLRSRPRRSSCPTSARIMEHGGPNLQRRRSRYRFPPEGRVYMQKLCIRTPPPC